MHSERVEPIGNSRLAVSGEADASASRAVAQGRIANLDLQSHQQRSIVPDGYRLESLKSQVRSLKYDLRLRLETSELRLRLQKSYCAPNLINRASSVEVGRSQFDAGMYVWLIQSTVLSFNALKMSKLS